MVAIIIFKKIIVFILCKQVFSESKKVCYIEHQQ